MFDPNWDRWIAASIVDSIRIDLEAASVPWFVETQLERTTAGLTHYVEIRVDGPGIEEPSKNYFKFEVEVNLVISTIPNLELYKQRKYTGIAAATLRPCITVKKMGNEVGDDNSPVFVLRRSRILDADREVRTNHFGKISPEINLFQSTVEAHYKGTLS